jgi:SAM-dependent methyltransferase
MAEQRPPDGSKYTSHAGEDALLAVAEIEICRRTISRALGGPLQASDALLDVGCGSSGDGVEIAGKAQYHGIDADGECLPFHMQSKRVNFHPVAWENTDGWPARSSVVLSKRMLCQQPEEDHFRAIRQMWRLVRPGGALLLCEPWKGHRDYLNAARLSWGLRALPEPASGGHPIDLDTAYSATGQQPVVHEAVAPEYVVWTRLLSEVLTGKLPGYSAGWPRRCPFVMDPLYVKLAFYRAVAWVKAK